MSERPGIPNSVVGPAGEPLTIESLPPPDTKRWINRRKAEVVAAVCGGLISLEAACERYQISTEVFLSWQQLIERRCKHRLCLMCCTPFMSTWSGERVCPNCKRDDAWRHGNWLLESGAAPTTPPD